MHSVTCVHVYPHTQTEYINIYKQHTIYISREMCVFNRVMVDSGTIQFIASQEMARKQGHGDRAASSAFSLGVEG